MAKDFNYKGINYTSFDGKTCSVKSSLDDDIANDVTGDVVIPPFVFDEDSNKYVVTAIGEGGFFSIKGGPTSVSIAVAVKTIGKSAFEQCSNLNYVYLPEELTEIKPFTFNGCGSLHEIELPKTLEVIGKSAFVCSGLQSLKLPASLKLIGEYAFMGCDLTSVIIGESVLLIGNEAFKDSDNLQNVTSCNPVPPKTYLGDKLFSKETYENGILYVHTESVRAYSEAPGWKQFKHIEGINYENGDFIYNGIVYTRTSKTTCRTRNGKGMVKMKPGNEVHGNVVIPKIAYDEYGAAFNVEAIGKDGFRKQTELNAITLPNGVNKIGECAFTHCDGLSCVQLPKSVETIGSYAFAYCANLSAVTILGPVKVIDDCAFSNCDKLSVITMMGQVEAIGKHAFIDTNLRGLFLNSVTPPAVSEVTFEESAYNNTTLYVPAESVAAYSEAPIWSLFKNIMAID
jgi:hypothetical protein